jgi:hypothetical protein
MIHETRNDPEEWKYASEAMNWYGWGSPVGLGLGFALCLMSIGAFVLLLHDAGVIR